MGAFARRFACLTLLVAPAVCDEMAFVDVTATDEMTVRFLDVRVKSKAGIAGLFEPDPMISHDWTSTSTVNRTLSAVIRASGSGSPIARQIQAIEGELAPLFAVLAKNENLRLSREAVRYALHRYFSGKYGWSIKGLEPAGSAWVQSMPVTPDVRQLTKYIMPGYVMETLFEASGGQGLDLRWLAIFATALERLIHAEMSEYLYDVFTTLGLPLEGPRSPAEVQQVVKTFTMVFALGSDLEVSTKRAMERLDEFLAQRHGAWPQLQAFAQELLAQEPPAATDFQGLLAFAEVLAARYAAWQSRDCRLAQDVLQASAGFENGRLPVSEVRPHHAQGHRALFTESPQQLKVLGAMEDDKMIMTNYLQSQDMCLSTASFYAVCCPDACAQRLALIERAVAAPAGAAAAIADAVGATPAQRAALEAAAAATGGSVALHGQAMSNWLHQSFPNECAAPSEQYELNPRTADEWMRGPRDDAKETEELMSELSYGVAQFATLGLDVQSWEEAPEDVEVPETPVESILGGGEEVVEAVGRVQAAVSAASRLIFALVLLGSMAGAVRAALGAALGGLKGRDAKGGKAAGLMV